MKLLRKIYNILFNPFKIDTCGGCDHTNYFHHPDRVKANYPGITCYGSVTSNPFKNDAWKYTNRCRCQGFITKTNLDYLEYKAKEAGV